LENAMRRIRRRFLFGVAEIGVYRCIIRCVGRALLYGQDSVSGKDFEHAAISSGGTIP
jgi:hypothetical protein